MSDWTGIKLEIMNYIRKNIRGGTRWTNVESMFQALGVDFADQFYMDREKIVIELLRDGELVTFTEEWRDYCWLVPKDFDHIARFPGTSATVRCRPFGYGLNDIYPEFSIPTCPRCKTNKLANWDDDECAYCEEARSEGRPRPGSTGP